MIASHINLKEFFLIISAHRYIYLWSCLQLLLISSRGLTIFRLFCKGKQNLFNLWRRKYLLTRINSMSSLSFLFLFSLFFITELNLLSKLYATVTRWLKLLLTRHWCDWWRLNTSLPRKQYLLLWPGDFFYCFHTAGALTNRQNTNKLPVMLPLVRCNLLGVC